MKQSEAAAHAAGSVFAAQDIYFANLAFFYKAFMHMTCCTLPSS